MHIYNIYLKKRYQLSKLFLFFLKIFKDKNVCIYGTMLISLNVLYYTAVSCRLGSTLICYMS